MYYTVFGGIYTLEHVFAILIVILIHLAVNPYIKIYKKYIE